MRIAYLDAFSGVAGDMTVGALLDLGMPIELVRGAIDALGLRGVELSAERVERGGIAATKFHVRVHGEHPDRPGAHAHGAHGHRSWRDIRALLAASRLDAPVRERALAVFARLAEAEGEAHGVPAEDVTFHEVGALDAIVDVVGAALGFTHLGVDAVHCSALPLGRGMVQAAHGPLPVPGPAVAALLRGRAVRLDDGATELVTPTGAAIVAALAAAEPVPELRVERVGYGAGDRVLADRPNLLRIVLGEATVAAGSDDVVVLEATVDDTLPELWEHVLERLLEAGAKDALLEPVVMKKSRPGVTLRVIAAAADRDRLAAIVFAETSTIGLRWAPWRRMVLRRETRTVDTVYGTVTVKVAIAPDGTANLAPEFEDCRRLARARGVAAKLVYQAALAAAHAQGR
ncbi:MAG TPA: nickel pincer cofactor biosynthesis protein LarC [Candidatus Limnocylindria bacterium]|nr:nickel pincer cofactor biosynthesis protein LarC [Candidatus Limnocylindria bacterium]